jgi:hypothetical protein
MVQVTLGMSRFSVAAARVLGGLGEPVLMHKFQDWIGERAADSGCRLSMGPAILRLPTLELAV